MEDAGWGRSYLQRNKDKNYRVLLARNHENKKRRKRKWNKIGKVLKGETINQKFYNQLNSSAR